MTTAAGHAGDVLHWPVIGPFLRWRGARTSLQTALLAATAVMVAHGLWGPQIAPANLATVLTWVHYRGLLIVGLLAAGNLFCTGCPFVLVRDGMRRLHRPARQWPRWLRRKWPAVVLFVGILFTYELFDLWSLPRATSWLVIGYFAGAVLVDTAFSGASFCKYVCPIGQFNFVASTLSPLEVQVRDVATCHSCRTVDCIKGRRAEAAPLTVIRRGCELDLFLPAKVGNMDCTFCLDCVQACPHDNVAVAPRVPGLELADARRRSGVGRLALRWDLTVFVILFVFGALVNALGMIAPVQAVERWLAGILGTSAEAPVLAVLFGGTLLLAPALVLGAAAWCSAHVAGGTAWRQISAYVYALVPIGTAVWAAHYLFHLLTGALTVVPVTQSAAFDLFGWAVLGVPKWTWTGLRPGTVLPLQFGFVIVGAIASIAIVYLVAEREHPERPGVAALPWAVVTAVLAVAALWILAQPMDMRAAGVLG